MPLSSYARITRARLTFQRIQSSTNVQSNIEIKWHWIREVVESGRIKVKYISIKEMIADGLTKSLSGQLFKAFKDMMGMRTDITKRRFHDA